MNKICALVWAIIAIPASAAQNYPFVGKWDCEVSTFTFTSTSYDNGSEKLRIKKVRKVGGNYELSFAGNYKISVGRITAKTMSWLSGETGDAFSCKRLR